MKKENLKKELKRINRELNSLYEKKERVQTLSKNPSIIEKVIDDITSSILFMEEEKTAILDELRYIDHPERIIYIQHAGGYYGDGYTVAKLQNGKAVVGYGLELYSIPTESGYSYSECSDFETALEIGREMAYESNPYN